MTTTPTIVTALRMLGLSPTEAQRQWTRQAKRKGVSASRSDAPLVAHVNHGRWIAICACGAGVACDPTWPEAYCYDCCTAYPIAWPAGKADIETALLARPEKASRNWLPAERVDDLLADNILYGVQAVAEKE